MAELAVREDIAEALHRIAANEKRPLEDVLRSMIKLYTAQSEGMTTDAQAIEAFISAYDDDVPDISSTVRETIDAYYRKKYGNSG